MGRNEKKPKTASRSGSRLRLSPRIRIYRGADIALGPGKVELLEALEATKSITGAAKQLGMSYMRAWNLLQTMEGCFKDPLTRAVRGGVQGGGAELTEAGKAVLTLYRQMEAQSLDAMEESWIALQKFLLD
jgi:molybdate transport system regulatory protein